MKNKDLIEKLQQFNPDGTAVIFIPSSNGSDPVESEILGVKDEACALINSVIIGKP